VVAAGFQVGIVVLAYVLLRWFDKPVRAWLTRKYAGPVHVAAGVAEANA
jgi:peptidoglycan/LPS O-acetylase OafA/YrhL